MCRLWGRAACRRTLSHSSVQLFDPLHPPFLQVANTSAGLASLARLVQAWPQLLARPANSFEGVVTRAGPAAAAAAAMRASPLPRAPQRRPALQALLPKHICSNNCPVNQPLFTRLTLPHSPHLIRNRGCHAMRNQHAAGPARAAPRAPRASQPSLSRCTGTRPRPLSRWGALAAAAAADAALGPHLCVSIPLKWYAHVHAGCSTCWPAAAGGEGAPERAGDPVPVQERGARVAQAPGGEHRGLEGLHEKQCRKNIAACAMGVTGQAASTSFPNHQSHLSFLPVYPPSCWTSAATSR